MKLVAFVLFFYHLKCFCCSTTIRPVVFIHGLSGTYKSMEFHEALLKADFPGIDVRSLNAFNGNESDQPIEHQIQVFSEMVRNITDEYGDITLAGESQGAFIARAILQTSDNPHIHTLLSLAGPGNFKNTFIHPNTMPD